MVSTRWSPVTLPKNNVRQYFNWIFPNRWIGRGGSMEGPTQCYAIILLLRRCMSKSNEYKTNPLDLTDKISQILPSSKEINSILALFQKKRLKTPLSEKYI